METKFLKTIASKSIGKRSFHTSCNQLRWSASISLLNSNQNTISSEVVEDTLVSSSQDIETELNSIKNQLSKLRAEVVEKKQTLKQAKSEEKVKTTEEIKALKSQRFMTAEMIFTMTNFHLIRDELIGKGQSFNEQDETSLSMIIEEAKLRWNKLSEDSKTVYLNCEKQEQQKYIHKLENYREIFKTGKYKLPALPHMRSPQTRADILFYQQEYEQEMLFY